MLCLSLWSPGGALLTLCLVCCMSSLLLTGITRQTWQRNINTRGRIPSSDHHLSCSFRAIRPVSGQIPFSQFLAIFLCSVFNSLLFLNFAVIGDFILIPLHSEPSQAVQEINGLYDVFEEVSSMWNNTVSTLCMHALTHCNRWNQMFNHLRRKKGQGNSDPGSPLLYSGRERNCQHSDSISAVIISIQSSYLFILNVGGNLCLKWGREH